MAKCWRCGGGKTISMTTTGTHVLPCPTCGGSGESPGFQAPITGRFWAPLDSKKMRAGESIGAAYIVGYFDDVQEMERTYDRYKGKSSIVLEDGKFRLE